MIVPLGRARARAEEPVLQACGLTMWGYRVLLTLAAHPARSQAALAGQIGADKTRLIPVLDDLQERGLIERHPDPADRRVRLLSVTPEGHRFCSSAQARIQQQEEDRKKNGWPCCRPPTAARFCALSMFFRQQNGKN